MELPLRIAVFDKSKKGQGLKMISLVDKPAIGFEAIKMSEQMPVKLSIQNEDERIILTPVLIPNQKIYRNIDGYEFNLMFEENTIKDIATEWQRNHLSTNADINHSRNLIDGVVWFETFVLSDKRVKEVVGFEGMPLGTWFVSGKVEDDGVWGKIKSGEIKGVSIDGVFDAMLVQQSNQELIDDETLEKAAKIILKEILNNK